MVNRITDTPSATASHANTSILNSPTSAMSYIIETVSVTRPARKRRHRTICPNNLVKINLTSCSGSATCSRIKLGLLNIRSLAPKADIVNEIITDKQLSVLCLTETWVKQGEYLALNESTPPGFSYYHTPRISGRGGGVATLYNTDMGLTQIAGHKTNAFEFQNIRVASPCPGSTSLILSTVYRPPGPYSEFLTGFAEFLTDIALSADMALIVGDFNIHFENNKDPLKIAFEALIDSMGYIQNVIGPTHRCNHTLDLVLSRGIRVENLDTVPQSDCISDHHLILYEVILDYNVYMPPRYRYKRSITASTIDALINRLPDLSNVPAPLGLDELESTTEYVQSTLQSTLDSVAPIKRKIVRRKTLAPWYNDHTRTLKQKVRSYERKWRITKLDCFRSEWKNTLLEYKHALHS